MMAWRTSHYRFTAIAGYSGTPSTWIGRRSSLAGSETIVSKTVGRLMI